MSEGKHISNKWTVVSCSHNGISDYNIADENGRIFADVEDEKRAHLIAAAPEMLAMLKLCNEYLMMSSCDSENLKALIRKAESAEGER